MVRSLANSLGNSLGMPYRASMGMVSHKRMQQKQVSHGAIFCAVPLHVCITQLEEFMSSKWKKRQSSCDCDIRDCDIFPCSMSHFIR
jgi:hypothetical protein